MLQIELEYQLWEFYNKTVFAFHR
eukprot:SAG11_NODE_39957_length_216_cov_11.418803_1_plen_23_part_01